MGRTALGLLVVAHGLVTVLIWSPAPDDDAPMRTSRSWLLGEARGLSVALAVSSGLLLVASGLGLVFDGDWWAVPGVAGGVLSLVLLVLFFSPWWLAAIAINGAVVAAAVDDLV